MTGGAPRPRVVVITGAPGSGKTTLGTALARALRVPFLARDDVRTGLFLTEGAWSEHPRAVPTSEEAVEAFLRIVEGMADLGVSCVVEYVLRRGRPEDLRRLTAVADCRVLHTRCADADGRFARREAADRLLDRPPVLAVLGYASREEHTARAAERNRQAVADLATDHGLPTLSVTTDGEHAPGLDAIIDFVVGT